MLPINVELMGTSLTTIHKGPLSLYHCQHQWLLNAGCGSTLWGKRDISIFLCVLINLCVFAHHEAEGFSKVDWISFLIGWFIALLFGVHVFLTNVYENNWQLISQSLHNIFKWYQLKGKRFDSVLSPSITPHIFQRLLKVNAASKSDFSLDRLPPEGNSFRYVPLVWSELKLWLLKMSTS